MHHFFAEPSGVEDGRIRIEGADAEHMRRVLRMRPGEELLVSDGEGRDYLCRVEELAGDRPLTSMSLEELDKLWERAKQTGLTGGNA